ncbi:ATP synthase membrane subunit K, mitochondrial [Hyperolius riggenbachi]|uniref:ATP synthase membrane subunit K, mitochondrial n=1 Tax=Hyperolius riggenbachi TaxID=752182 RepID=UPI0035A2A861
MGGHETGTYNFTGIKKYFNSYTLVGRRNCVLATYGTIAGIILFFKLKPKKKAAVTEKVAEK